MKQSMVPGKKLWFFLALALVLMSMSAIGAAQELQATLTGTVSDPSGALVAGATVVVHNEDSGADVRSVATSSSGNFNITNLPAGRYTVTVNEAGFQTFVTKDVILNVAEKHTLDVQLKAGQVSERVEVTAENTPIQTTTAEESGTVTGEQVRELALNNRNFEQLVLLQPGVANGLPDKVGFGLQNSTEISINGAHSSANNWTVDGGDINDSGSNGTLLNTPGIDAIQEFTLERSNYDAAFGRSGGGQVVVATKSGTTSSMARRLNSIAIISTTPTPLRIARRSPLAAPGPTMRPPSSATTITASPSADRYSFRKSFTRRRTRHFSSGRKSGARQVCRRAR
jgi:Carboxypeptidase regulatory-like domain/TonB-dependent Receptor Plug Domain